MSSAASFSIVKYPEHYATIRVSGGPPDKIWSFLSWSPQMAHLSLHGRSYCHRYFAPTCEDWLNKIPVQDSRHSGIQKPAFGQRTPRPPDLVSPRPTPLQTGLGVNPASHRPSGLPKRLARVWRGVGRSDARSGGRGGPWSKPRFVLDPKPSPSRIKSRVLCRLRPSALAWCWRRVARSHLSIQMPLSQEILWSMTMTT